MAREVANLLDYSTAEFLQATVEAALPALVVRGNLEAVQALAAGLRTTVEALGARQLGAVMAHILLRLPPQEQPEPLRFVVESLLGSRLPLFAVARSAGSAMLRYLVDFLGEQECLVGEDPEGSSGVRERGVSPSVKTEQASPRAHALSPGEASVRGIDVDHPANRERREVSLRALRRMAELRAEEPSQKGTGVAPKSPAGRAPATVVEAAAQEFLKDNFLALIDIISTRCACPSKTGTFTDCVLFWWPP